MEINFDSWVSDRMNFDDDAKRICIETANEILYISIDIRKRGLLVQKDRLSEFKRSDMFLHKALSLAIDSYTEDDIRKILQSEIVEGDYRGEELLRRILIIEGIRAIICGNNPMRIADYLASFFGENYFRLRKENLYEYIYW